jgi:endonuclease/exonuclease/phosphatase family metal-dependent hydrolase
MRARILVPAVGAVAVCLVCLSAARCVAPVGPGTSSGSLRIVAYNVHNLFDAHDDGLEYPEYSVARGRWDEGRYRARLASVAKAVGAALSEGDWPEVLCLEEVENGKVLEDLATGPLKAAGYRSIAIAPVEGSPINSGLLSKYVLLSVKAHALSGGGSARPGRSLLEVKLDAGGRALTVFVVHWKSKVEGAEETEGGRREAAALLSGRVGRILAADPGAELVVCGDFNESPDEYIRVGRRYPTALMPATEIATATVAKRALVAFESRGSGGSGGEPVFYSPWAESSGYSYSYKGKRERLDGFLLASGLLDGEGLSYRDFSVVDAPFLLDGEGQPVAWSSSTATGYSDHLPILLVLEAAGR